MSTPNDSTVATLATSRGSQLDELCARLEQGVSEDEARLLCDFARIFFARLPRPITQDRTPEELTALVRGSFRFLESARPEGVNVEVVQPEAEGWDAPVTLLRAKVGDRPFIVDSIREYLASEEIVIHHFVHPVMRVERDAAGELLGVAPVGAETGGAPQAVVYAELSRIAEPERREALRREIERRLGDVVVATDDFARMLEALEHTTERVRANETRFPERAAEFTEIADFLDWLRDGNFVFLGFRSYAIGRPEAGGEIVVEPGSGLGILSDETHSTWASAVPLSQLDEALLRRVTAGPPLIVSKTNAEATVHRSARMDYIGIKRLDDAGRVTGEDRFLGLFTSKAYAEHADLIPILRSKLARVLDASGATPGSHDYKEIITIFNSMPKEDLFQASSEELQAEVETVLSLVFADEVRVTLRPDPLGRGVSVMVILPRGRFSGEVRHRIQQLLAERLQGTVLNYHLAMSAGDQARMHFYLSAEDAEAVATVDPHDLEIAIAQIIRSWQDRLKDELAGVPATAPEAEHLARLYAPAFTEEYRAATPPAAAVTDVMQLERMRREQLDVAVYMTNPAEGVDGLEGVTRLSLYLRGERLMLSDFMPILDNAGVKVVEVTPYTVVPENGHVPAATIYTFAVRGPDGAVLPLERSPLLAELLLAVRRGEAVNDAFNTLAIGAGLRWREIDVLRTYANYAFQVGLLPTRFAPARALVRYPEVARLLIDYFAARFDPAHEASASREAEMAARREGVLRALNAVATLADDRALRSLLRLMEATMRTNYYRHGGAAPTKTSGGAPYISIKVRSADMEELRKTRLMYEIFVHSARMEGIHLRGAPVARGGIRWSDRPDDFRTEVLSLTQTQVIKNAVIVPGGSKGGFITKLALPDRDAMMAEAADQYRTMMRGMLDITDNLVGGEVVPPEGVVRHDGDDPYLVVAADKGTAHLSDTANAVAAEYDFWLGDAFASGGSHGYDHKKQGITARGAWECVKRHFRELGKDIQAEPFTVAGIGDMSGDVFGNGMRLSRQIKLLAAFDHRHVFIDPDPDPAASFEERERLYFTPRSSWDDYDRSVLSKGAMIVPRASKEIELTPEAKQALGLEESVERLDGEALVRAVLRAPVELLWNGGIGTYVKDETETNADVGDPANDPVRVNAQELRATVVGEGGNLGFTQRARISYALAGGRNNTDALDNSGGVDMSDHEVNLKILLGSATASGKMTMDARNELLEAMTDEVSQLVLGDNISQSLAVSLDEARSNAALDQFAALISSFEREGLLDRIANGIPSSDELRERIEDGIGMTRPTLCVLLAYSKMHAKTHLLASGVPDDAAAEPYLFSYFPAAAVEAVGRGQAERHPLRREIIATALINDLVGLMGSSFLHRTARDTGAEIPAVVRAWLIASRISGAAALRADLAALEGQVPAEVVHRWYHGLTRVLERTTRWVLDNVAPEAPMSEVIAEHHDGLARLRDEFAELVAGVDRELFETRVAEITPLAVDEALGRRLITLRFLPQLLNILRIAQESGAEDVEAARAFYLVAERYATGRLRRALREAAGDDLWERRYAQALAADVDRIHRTITRAVLACEQENDRALEACLDDFDLEHARTLAHYHEVLDEVQSAERASLAGYAMAARALTAVAAK
jgi:glutamate dehydrogenase